MPSKNNPTTRNICWTLHITDKYPELPGIPLKFPDEVKYCIYQKEKCPDTGRIHLQGYMELSKSLRYSAIKKIFDREDIHLEARRGTRDEARDYCLKAESKVEGPWEHGDFGKSQGSRSDLLSVQAAIKKGAKENEIFDQFFAQSARHHKFFSKYIALNMPKRTTKTKGVLFLGPPRVGKTSHLAEIEKGAYWHSSAMGTWFDEYEHQKVVIFDDIYANIPFTQYLGMIDSKPYAVQVKGDKITWNPEKIYVVANSLPETWYKNERNQYDMRAFYGRFEEFWWMDQDREIQKFESAQEFIDFVKSQGSENVQDELPASPVV